MSKAVDEMVIHHPDGLHVRVDNRRAHEGETAALEILTHGVRLAGVSGNLPHGPPWVLDRTTVDEPPLVRVEAIELLQDFEKRLGVLDCRFDLCSVAHDPRVSQQRRNLPFVVAGDLLWI